MAKRVVDDASLKSVADEMRAIDVVGEIEFPDGFRRGVRECFEHGRTLGYAEGLAVCDATHFVHNFPGDGNGSVSFRVPFEPDAIEIICFDPLYNTRKDNRLYMLCLDLRALGQLAGFTQYCNGSGGVKNAALNLKSIRDRIYSRTEDGVVTVKQIHTSDSVIFATDCVYTVVAVKYVERTDKERITALVNSLTGSGTASLQKAAVEAAFTDEEWAALIDTKPNWTFNLV